MNIYLSRIVLRCAVYWIVATAMQSAAAEELVPFQGRGDPWETPANWQGAPGKTRWGAIEAEQSLQAFDSAGAPLDAYVEPFEPWKELPWRQRQDGDPRAVGLGDPLVGTSWLNRPFHAGWLVGGLFGDQLTTTDIRQNNDLVGGYRLGWDFDYYWGTEVRFAFSNVDYTDPDDAATARTAKNQYLDLNLVYFPWGDSRWRPFVSAGVGLGRFKFTPADDETVDEHLFLMPLSAGVKHYFKNWMALRFTVTDNWAVGNDSLASMHNLMVTADVEMRFGGRRPSYFPYNGSIHIW